jgi:heterodisulfide reductase subunit A-like polyferredoxin
MPETALEKDVALAVETINKDRAQLEKGKQGIDMPLYTPLPPEIADIEITFADGTKYSIGLNKSDPGVDVTRFMFNPSGLQSVNVLKALFSAAISYCYAHAYANNSYGYGDYCEAIKYAKIASMLAVSGATAHLGKPKPVEGTIDGKKGDQV